MKFFASVVYLLATSSAARALYAPKDSNALSGRDLESSPNSSGIFDTPQLLSFAKRRGGGGRGGGGGSKSGSSGGSKGGSSGGSSSGSSGSGSGSGSGSTSHTSNVGGRTSTGSGTRPAYGGGAYYGGGARVPFRAGASSPSGLSPRYVGLGALGGVGVFGPFHAPLYVYAFSHPFVFHNSTNNANETLPVECVCQQYQECGCDNNSNSTYVTSIVGDGSYSTLMAHQTYVTQVNGTEMLLINGTLPNGTTAAGAGSGTRQSMLANCGFCFLLAVVIWGCFLL